VILFAIFKQPSLALVALIPNALPVAIAFGAMGLLGVAIDAGTVFVGNLALGIAVDDTIHELTEFHRRRTLGADVRSALEGAFRQVLRPLVYTTVAVTAGFAVLGISSFTYTRNLGLLTAGVMILCLAADLLLLPMILIRWNEPRGRPLRADTR
jgi:predicted RND superfamily exporter protein